MGLISRVSSRTYRIIIIAMSKILVTGTNRGIGLELVKQLTAAGNKVFATCRSASDELKKVDNVVILENVSVDNDGVIDVLKSSEDLPEKLDGVICNAGVLVRNNLESLSDTSTLLQQFQTNSLGPLRVFKGVESRLGSGSKFAIVTSRMGSVADNGSGGHYGYRMSKSAVNSAAKSLSIDLQERGVAVALLHPGYVRTDMTDHNGFIDTPESASGLIARYQELNMSNTGTFWHMNGEI